MPDFLSDQDFRGLEQDIAQARDTRRYGLRQVEKLFLCFDLLLSEEEEPSLEALIRWHRLEEVHFGTGMAWLEDAAQRVVDGEGYDLAAHPEEALRLMQILKEAQRIGQGA